MEKIENENQIFHRNCGEILRMGVGVEDYLDFIISNYFCSPQNYKTSLFKDLILIDSLGFERKIQIFKEICKKEDIDKERIDDIIDSARFVQNIRNRVAHDEAFISDQKEGIKLRKPKSIQLKKDEIKISDELVREVGKKRLFAIQEIGKIHLELSNPSREKKMPSW